MNTDPSVNVVVFEVMIGRRLENLLGDEPTRAADGIRRVWEELAAGFGVRPADVRRVYSQWGATPDDRAFLAAEFPAAVKVSCSFHRPPARRDWGNGTPEFVSEVGEFGRLYYATGVKLVGRRRDRSRPPWWQYWEVKNGRDGQPKRCRCKSRPPWWQYWD